MASSDLRTTTCTLSNLVGQVTCQDSCRHRSLLLTPLLRCALLSIQDKALQSICLL